MKALKLLAVVCVYFSSLANAVTTITPNATLVDASTATVFGPSAITFGGSGIPTNAVALTNVGGNLTLAMGASPRFGVDSGGGPTSNPPLTHDANAVFHALAGVDLGVPSSGSDPYARWNFNFFAGGNLGAYNLRLYYDFDPGSDTDIASLGYLAGRIPSSNFAIQDSFNLGMNFLASGPALPGFTQVFPASSFDPNATGEYTFSLVAYNRLTDGSDGTEAGRASMLVNVVPEPSTYALLLAGLSAITFVARRRRKQA